MPTSSQPTNPLKSLDLNYKKIKLLREILIEEMKEEVGMSHITIDHMRLVEDRIQTLIMANVIDDVDIKKEIREPKVHL